MMTENIELKIVGSDEEYAQAMAVRRKVFIEEMSIPPEKEFDGNDYSATHVLALENGKPVGTMRMRYFGGFMKFERACVLKDYRKSDISEQIMRKGMEFAAKKGFEKVIGVCKPELLNRWRRDGFMPIEGAQPIEQNGMTLIPICCSLPPVYNPITMQTAPEILNAKEGDWDKVQTPVVDNSVRKDFEKLAEKVRALRKTNEVKSVMPDDKHFFNQDSYQY